MENIVVDDDGYIYHDDNDEINTSNPIKTEFDF